jgi:hypothetical protein
VREQSTGKIADSLTPRTPKDRAEIKRITRLEVTETLNELHDPAKFNGGGVDDAGSSPALAGTCRGTNCHFSGAIRDIESIPR